MVHIRAFLRNGKAIRLTLAFLAGLAIGVLANRLGAGLQNLVPFLLFPLVIGALSALTVGSRAQHPHLLVLGTALLAWGGIGISLALINTQATLMPSCTGTICNSTTARALAFFLLYLLLGLLLVVAGALPASLLLRRLRRPT